MLFRPRYCLKISDAKLLKWVQTNQDAMSHLASRETKVPPTPLSSFGSQHKKMEGSLLELTTVCPGEISKDSKQTETVGYSTIAAFCQTQCFFFGGGLQFSAPMLPNRSLKLSLLQTAALLALGAPPVLCFDRNGFCETTCVIIFQTIHIYNCSVIIYTIYIQDIWIFEN